MPAKPPRQTKRRPPQEPAPGFIAVGLVRAARGIHGELRVEPLTDVEGRFESGAALHVNGTIRTVARSRADRNGLLLILEGVTSRTEADALKGMLLEVPESASPPLEEDTYYLHQVIGLRVHDTRGNELGRVAEVMRTGANDVFVVRDKSGETLIPALDSVVKTVDLDGGSITVELIDGLERRPLIDREAGKRGPNQPPTQPSR